MTTKNYYPLPVAASAPPGTFGIINMWDSIASATEDAIEKYTANPSGNLAYQFTAVAADGVTPYTYAWSTQSGFVAISNTTVANPVFSASGEGRPTTLGGVFSLTVTDSTSPTPQTDTKYVCIRFHFGTGEALPAKSRYRVPNPN